MRYPVRLGLMAMACAGVTLAGCGTQRAATASAATPAQTPAQTPGQRAAADAAGLLAAFPAPQGAARTGAPPVSWLSQSPETDGSTDVATRTGWWRVAGQPVTVLGWIRGHMPSGFALELSGSGEPGPRIVLEPAHPGPAQHGVKMWFDQFTKPPVANVLSARWLVVSVADDGTGETAIRVDAEVAWVPARSAAERIPATAKVVTLAPLLGNAPVSAAGQPVTISDPAKVAKIASAVNALPLFQQGRMMCPMDRGLSMRLTFLAAPAGPVLAVATAGHQYPVLGGGSALERQVMTIAGAHWPGFPAA